MKSWLQRQSASIGKEVVPVVGVLGEEGHAALTEPRDPPEKCSSWEGTSGSLHSPRGRDCRMQGAS